MLCRSKHSTLLASIVPNNMWIDVMWFCVDNKNKGPKYVALCNYVFVHSCHWDFAKCHRNAFGSLMLCLFLIANCVPNTQMHTLSSVVALIVN